MSSGVSGRVSRRVKRPSNPKQYVNWLFVIQCIDPNNYEHLEIPHQWITTELIIFVTYQLERGYDDNVPFYLLRGILRCSRKVSQSRLRLSLGIDPDDDDESLSLCPFPGVLDSSRFDLVLIPENRFNGVIKEYGARFVPRQGLRRDLLPQYRFVDVNPGPPPCTNKCSCCSIKYELQQELSEKDDLIKQLREELVNRPVRPFKKLKLNK